MIGSVVSRLSLLLFFIFHFQQAEVIRERTGFQVGHYCGEMGQDFWDARRWQREFESKQVACQFPFVKIPALLSFELF